MCYRKPCKACGKTTWGGCGRHIEEALEDVPEEDLCQCDAPPQAGYLSLEGEQKA